MGEVAKSAKISKSAFIHPSAFVEENVEIQNDVMVWHFSQVRKNACLERNVSVGKDGYIKGERTC